MKKLINITAILLMVAMVTVTVDATTISDLTNAIEQDKNNLSEINSQISDMEDEQDVLEEEISDLDAELINLMTSIGLLEEEIDILQGQINVTQKDYEEAVEVEEKQYEDMKVRIKFMYERGNESILNMFLGAENFGDLINKADYIEQLYSYDRKMLSEYQAVKEQVASLKAQLEADMTTLEGDKTDLEAQEEELDILLAEKRAQSENFDAQIAKAKQQAAYYKTKIKQEEAELKKLQDEEKKKNANSGNYNVDKFDTSIIDKSSGSELGKNIAKYACQYIGNPYVPGGTSLTKGADCSGFTYRVYKDFGYNLPRTSFQQRSAGKSVDYSEAQPGDIICYDGHVGIYVGGGYIVHASTQKTGIKVSRATYRTILSVRRII